MRNSKSSKRALASIVLGFESFVIFFATLLAFGLEVADPLLVWSVGLSFALLCIVTPAFLARPWGYWIGWGELLFTVVGYIVLLQIAYAVTTNPNAQSLQDQLSYKPENKRKYND